MKAPRPKQFGFEIWLLGAIMVLCLGIVGVRLWFVQVKLSHYYRSKIHNNSEVTVRLPAVRGEIRDRNGLTLVTNRVIYNVDFYFPDLVTGYRDKYGYVPTKEVLQKDASGMLHNRRQPDIVQIVDQTVIPRLKQFGLAEPYNTERLETQFRNQYLVPFTYRQDLDFLTFSAFAERNGQFPGLQVNSTPIRQYLYGALAAQILGYVGAPKEISHLPDLKDFDYYQPDIQGRTNLEYALDDVLRGKPGKRILKKSAKNQIEGETQVVQPTPGSDVYLTIDAKIQYVVESLLRLVGRGACVVVDPNNGQVLAMASVPSFDPNKFVPSISAHDWRAIKNAEADPLVDRATSAYAPGSTYKIITSLAGLTKGLAKAHFSCYGGVSYGDTYMHCWGHHGRQDLVEAIKNSCDSYFYQYGNAAGIQAIDRVGEALGLGQPTGIELTDEDPGLLPTPDWLASTKTEKWTPGQTANTSIGQGYVLASPIQMAMVAATIANGGICYQPTLVYQIKGPDGKIVPRPPRIRTDLIHDLGLTADQIALIRKGMYQVVNADDGTGKKGAISGIEVAGKTGTAQFWRNGKKDDHTWFLAFAPFDHPKYALAVMVEGGKSGGGVAAPLASAILGKIFALDKGFNPTLKPLQPAIGNHNIVDSINSAQADQVLTASSTSDSSDDSSGGSADDSEDRHSSDNEERHVARRKVQAEPDIRPEPDSEHRVAQAQEKRHSIFDLFRRQPAPAGSPQPAKKHHFLFF
ncbi:MAG: penicillin-binding protein 2 [Verrucomicrobia bacterium]|nr:penicillin-binding protein 2 [Verrucomicrobiota bacterium]